MIGSFHQGHQCMGKLYLIEKYVFILTTDNAYIKIMINYFFLNLF
jgi:hypothetical protein